MPAGPYEGQVPVREYEEDRAHEGRMQLIEISVTGYSAPSQRLCPRVPAGEYTRLRAHVALHSLSEPF